MVSKTVNVKHQLRLFTDVCICLDICTCISLT